MHIMLLVLIATLQLANGETKGNAYKEYANQALITSPSSEEVTCRGSFSCESAGQISTGLNVGCKGDFACSYISDIGQTSTGGTAYCPGRESCIISTFSMDIIQCQGSNSCAGSIINNPSRVEASGYYALWNASIIDPVEVFLDGAFSGYGATLQCSTGRCNITCSGTGCHNVLLSGSGQWNIIYTSNQSTAPITNQQQHETLTAFPIFGGLNDDQECVRVFDPEQANYQGPDIIYNGDGYLCCRGRWSCREIGRLTSINTVLCSGERSCRLVGRLQAKEIICSGSESCDKSTLISDGDINCGGRQSCDQSNIAAGGDVYCSGNEGCSSATINMSSLSSSTISFTGSRSGNGATIHCPEGTVCSIQCIGKDSCSTTSITCVGQCNVNCTLDSGCPLITSPNPTPAPTSAQSNPTTSIPTSPTIEPATQKPTNVWDDFVYSTWILPSYDNYFIGDPYSRFEAIIELSFTNIDESELIINCLKCFIWEYREINPNTTDEWNIFNHETSSDITVYNKISNGDNNNNLTSTLIINSIRRENNGYCFDENNVIFEPGKVYELRLSVQNYDYAQKRNSNPIYHQTESMHVVTNTMPTNGFCTIQFDDNSVVLDKFNLFCDEWSWNENVDELEYSVLMNGVLLSSEFMDNATNINGLIGAGDNIEMIVLIKESVYYDGITCFPIKNISFPDININDINDIIRNITYMTENEELCFDALPDAVTIHSIIEEMYTSQLISTDEATVLVDNLVYNILDCSIILISDDIANISIVGDVIQEIITVSVITSNLCIAMGESNNVLTNNYSIDVVETVDNYANSDDMTQNELNRMITATATFVTNMKGILSSNMNNNNDLFEILMDYTSLLSSYILDESVPGESFKIGISTQNRDCSNATKGCVGSTKYEIDGNHDVYSCGCGEQQVLIPKTLINELNKTGTWFDCTFMVPSFNGLIAIDNDNKLRSDMIVIDFYLAIEPDLDSKRSPAAEVTDECDPYFITFNISNDEAINLNELTNENEWKLNEENKFISCDFWNTTTNKWESNGCVVHNISVDEGVVVCACVHLTAFSVSYREFIPESNKVTTFHWRQLTVGNLLKYPTVWITILSILILFIILCLISSKYRERENRSILAYQDIIFKSVRDEKIINDITGKEIKYISTLMPNTDKLGYGIKAITPDFKSKKSLCYLVFRLYKVYIRNEHTVLSALQRTSGTNFSSYQRLGIFFMYLCTIFAMSAVFYGVEQKTFMGDISASFLISFISTIPTFIIKKLFMKSKPKTIESSKESVNFEIKRMPESLKIVQSSPSKATMSIINEEIIKSESEMAYSPSPSALSSQSIGDVSQNNIAELNLIMLATAVRLIIFNNIYPLSSKYKKYAWIILSVWTLIFCIIAIQYGIQFDLKYEAIDINEYDDNACWEIDMSLRIQSELSQKYIDQQQESLHSSYSDNYTQSDNDSRTWLLSLIQSFLISIFIWQPLFILISTFLKVWMFCWNLKMDIAPKTMYKLCGNACCGCCCKTEGDEENEIENEQNLKINMLKKEIKSRKKTNKHNNDNHNDNDHHDRIINEHCKFISNPSRPLDAIAFFSNDQLFIDDYDIDIVDQIKLMKPNKMHTTSEKKMVKLKSRNELMKLSKPKLVKMCKKYKVSSNGTKMDMVTRILNKKSNDYDIDIVDQRKLMKRNKIQRDSNQLMTSENKGETDDKRKATGPSRNELMKLSKPKLVKMCKENKVSSNGAKKDMVNRILNKKSNSKQKSNHPLIEMEGVEMNHRETVNNEDYDDSGSSEQLYFGDNNVQTNGKEDSEELLYENNNGVDVQTPQKDEKHSILEENGIDSTGPSRNELLKFSKAKLVKMCKKNKVSSNGTKMDMIARILNKKSKKMHKHSMDIDEGKQNEIDLMEDSDSSQLFAMNVTDGNPNDMKDDVNDDNDDNEDMYNDKQQNIITPGRAKDIESNKKDSILDGNSIRSTGPTRNELLKLSKLKLRKMCKKHKLSSNGTKKDMVNRILNKKS
eukprot:104176_1